MISVGVSCGGALALFLYENPQITVRLVIFLLVIHLMSKAEHRNYTTMICRCKDKSAKYFVLET